MRRHLKASTAGAHESARRKLGPLVALAVLASLALGVSSAAAAVPTVTVDPHPTVSRTTAEVSGTVDPHDYQTTYQFEYAEAGVGNWQGGISGPPLQPGSGPTKVSRELRFLRAGVEYELRLSTIGRNGLNETVEARSGEPNPTFTTLPSAAPTVTLANATAVSYTSAQLEGTINPNGGSDAIHYSFEYSKDPASQGWRPANGDQSKAGGDISDAEAEGTNPISVALEIKGLAPATKYFVRLNAERPGENNFSEPPISFTTDPVSPPAVSLEPITESTGTTAHFVGAINPDAPAGNPPAFDVKWHFECTPACPGLSGTIPADSSSHQVEADPTGLEPGTSYSVSLVAENAGGPLSGGPESFTTKSTVPMIALTRAIPTSTEAKLEAQINPGGLATTYRFEYGPTTAYGQTTPAQALPAGGAVAAVSAQVGGLGVGQTYHFRVVAGNSLGGAVSGDASFGTTAGTGAERCGNAEVREQQGSTFLPDCRAYEMVSPVEKFGSQAGLTPVGIPIYSRAAADGNRFVYYATGPIGQAVRGVQYYTTGTRTATGWTAQATIPGPEFGITPTAVSSSPNSIVIADDASRVAFIGLGPFVTENPYSPELEGSTASYLTTPDGPIQWLTRPQISSPEPLPGHGSSTNPSAFEGGSANLDTIYFSYCGVITAADAPRAGRRNMGFYVSENGRVSTAGTLPDGTVDPDGAIPAANFGGQGFEPCSRSGNATSDATEYGNTVSSSGDRALFVSPSPFTGSPRPSELYLHRRGQPSMLVSRSEITGEAAPSGVESFGRTFAFGSRTGPDVFFRTTDRLTNDAPGDPGLKKIYRFNVETGDLTYLAGVYDGSVPTLLAVSEDGSKVLFQTNASPSRLILWDEGVVHPVGTFAEGGTVTYFHTHVSADGSVFVFDSGTPFVGGNTTQKAGVVEVYRYVVGQSGPPTCISCVPPGETPSGPSVVSIWEGDGSTPWGGIVLDDARNVSTDGKRVFFQTPNALVPADTNGKIDVYEWSEGSVSLISTGKSGQNSYLFDSSASGDDVFFATAEGIDPRDTDESFDIYDARVGGGFLQTTTPPCRGDECQGPAGTPPSATSAGSGLVQGNAKPSKTKKPKLRVLKARSTGAGVSVRFQVSSKGRIVASGKGLRASRRSVSKAGSYSLKIGLTAKAKAEVGGGKRLKVHVRLKFTGAAGDTSSRTVTVTVRKK